MSDKTVLASKNLKVAILTAGPSTGVIGGAERFYSGLVSGFEAIDCTVELISIVADEPTFEAITDNYQRVRALDLSKFDMVVSTKAPTFAVKHPRHVVYLVHTVRLFDDMFSQAFPYPNEIHLRQRSILHNMDFEALSAAKALFAIGYEVANRLSRWRGLSAQVIHPPLGMHGFRNNSQGDYFFLPGRLHPWKRVDLVIDAVLQSNLALKLIIAGTGEAEKALRVQAGGNPRIIFLGRVDDRTLVDWYANALAVPFVPLREDYGYITLEAFASQKPVITCADSGEPSRLVRHRENGLICAPSAQSIQAALEWVHTHRDEAARMGKRGAEFIANMSWTSVAKQLLEAGYANEYKPVVQQETRVTVLDMQPIDPPVGGGRLRLLGLYHALGSKIRCSYIGSYDWPGESYRCHQLTETLEEIDIPLSAAHHAAARELSYKIGGKSVIDIAFGRQGNLSPEYIDAAKASIQDADIVVFSHPWVYPLVKDDISPNQTIVYDSQNVEGFLRAQLLDEANLDEAKLLHDLVDDELRLCQRADLILTCSQEDLERFNRIYRISAEKMRVIPNGVMAFEHKCPSSDERLAAKRQFGLDKISLIAFFIGSAYGPNVEAANFIVHELAPAIGDVFFVIGGGVGAQVSSDQSNVLVTGPLSDDQRKLWLTAADIAVNPMFSGSGTNIKMFDFMAMGLPVVTTDVGARGIETGSRKAMVVIAPVVKEFVSALRELFDPISRMRMGEEARACIERSYAWEKISPDTGMLFKARHRYANSQPPLFSVVIYAKCSIEKLNDVLRRIANQIERDFEVILIGEEVENVTKNFPFPIFLCQKSTCNSSSALNVGAALACGQYIAFLGSDHFPREDWLLNARVALATRPIAVEGVVAIKNGSSLKLQGGFDGCGAVVTNFIIKSEIYRLLGGFQNNFFVHDLSDPLRIGVRLRNIGNVIQMSSLVVEQSTISSIGSVIHVTTAGQKCGIGEYTKSLIHEIQKQGGSNIIISCKSKKNGLPENIGREPFYAGWFCDDEEYVGSHFSVDLPDLIKRLNPNKIVIQYHPAFYSIEVLSDFVDGCLSHGFSVVIDIHKFQIDQVPQLKEFISRGVVVAVHGKAEQAKAAQLDLEILRSPIGLDVKFPPTKRSIVNRDWIAAPPILVTTGFIRKHKGIRIIINALPEIQKNYPRARLLIQCAEYPSDDSMEEIYACKSLISELGLSEFVDFNIDFLEKETVFEKISSADIALLPYENSEEGGSAAVNDCFSVALPVLVSPAKIFEDVRHVTMCVNGDFVAWSRAVVSVLNSPVQYADMVNAAEEYALSNSWCNTTKIIFKM